MKDSADKVVFVLYGLFGAVLGLLIFLFALGGSGFVFTGHATKPWNGPVALVISCALGAGWGLVLYLVSDREFGSGGSSFFHDPTTAILFSRRLMVIASCLAALYFIWQMARGM